MSRLDLAGRQFGRLKVLNLAYTQGGRTFWSCICECNPVKVVVIKGKYLSNGDTRSCGCLNSERVQQMGLNNKKYSEYIINNDIVHVKLSNCEEEFICDLKDWEKSKPICWYKNNSGYVRGQKDGKMILFHDYIMNIVPEEKLQIDHIDGNRLNNTRKNLRVCDMQHNAYNHGIRTDNTSGVTGVSKHKSSKKWNAYINAEGKHINLGSFANFNEAVNARLNAENKYFKEYSRIITEKEATNE